jgi:glutathione synthase/RimK-type ligase-like ATP-grasp enzyme
MVRPLSVAVATCATLPEPDHDEAPLLGALARAGVLVSLLPWDGPPESRAWTAPGEGAHAPDLVLVRSTWSYAQALPAFLAWLAAIEASTTVANPPPVLRSNVDKLYLRELAARGVPIVPTAFVDRGSATPLAEVCAANGFDDVVVVKPRVSAGSWKTARFTAAERDAGDAALLALASERDAMVQPYIRSVEARGERSVVVLDGVPSHAVRKSPRFSGDDESVTRVALDDDEREFAMRVLEAAVDAVRPGAPLLYARVDTARDERGALLLMELELVEPSLFFTHAPEALPGFVAAVVREASRARAARDPATSSSPGPSAGA